MIRQIGVVVIAGGIAMLGPCAVAKLRERAANLRQLILAFEMMGQELDFRVLPLPELLERSERMTGGAVAAFFRGCAAMLREEPGDSFQQIWLDQLDRFDLHLQREELAQVEQLGAVLGRYDTENQCEAIRHTVERLGVHYGQAQERAQRLGTVYRILGLTAGGFVLVLLS